MNTSDQGAGKAITVTRTTLPPLDKYVRYLEQIWSSRWVTNNGPLVRELERQLRDHLGTPQLWLVNNCTTALQIALKALDLSGEIITTPFSYVATTGVVLWENCTPVFVDIRPDDLTIDPGLVEKAITPKTSAILATHVYGYPCAVDALEEIARRRGLKLIYDAAHAFGCRLRGRSLASYGDISCLSFHATKIFHTVEGGAIVINGDASISQKSRFMRAFGHIGEEHHCLGINGKNSELHAAMGLCNLPEVPRVIAERRRQHEKYRDALADSALTFPNTAADSFDYNYGYLPVLFPSEATLLRTLALLKERDIIPRRYFHPSLNRLPYVSGASCPVAESAAARVVCLPISSDVTDDVIATIADTVKKTFR